jgi:hypothetical protein
VQSRSSEPALRSDTEKFGDEERLTTASALASHLTLPFRIIWIASVPCNVRHALERAVAFGEPSAFLNGSVILLDHVV